MDSYVETTGEVTGDLIHPDLFHEKKHYPARASIAGS